MATFITSREPQSGAIARENTGAQTGVGTERLLRRIKPVYLGEMVPDGYRLAIRREVYLYYYINPNFLERLAEAGSTRIDNVGVGETGIKFIDDKGTEHDPSRIKQEDLHLFKEVALFKGDGRVVINAGTAKDRKLTVVGTGEFSVMPQSYAFVMISRAEAARTAVIYGSIVSHETIDLLRETFREEESRIKTQHPGLAAAIEAALRGT